MAAVLLPAVQCVSRFMSVSNAPPLRPPSRLLPFLSVNAELVSHPAADAPAAAVYDHIYPLGPHRLQF